MVQLPTGSWQDFLVGNMVFVKMHSILQQHFISMACILLCSSIMRVHYFQAYRKMDVTNERISRLLKLRGRLLSIQTGLNPVNSVVIYAILESI